MKRNSLLVFALLMVGACGTPAKKETAESTDSLSLVTELADHPASPTLAFAPMPGFAVRNTVGMQDSVNFMLINSQADLDRDFVYEKSLSQELIQPDFIINQVIAVVCLPSLYQTTLGLEKVEIADGAINVYVTMVRGVKENIPTKAAQVFAIERRDGFTTMQFYINGVKSTALLLI